MSSWTRPAGRMEADAWIAEHLERLGIESGGAFEQLHVRPWSTVIRVPTACGDVFFKANEPALCHEAALVERLAARCPEAIPPLLAVDRERGWMLMEDAGIRLRELVATTDDLRPWLDVLPLYARLQIELTGDADDLVALGVPDLRLAGLPARFEALLGELDWGDACVSHPFTLAVTLDGVIAWGVDDVEHSVDTAPFRDAYLEPFARALGAAGLAEASAVARRLGWACRAVNGHLAYDPG